MIRDLVVELVSPLIIGGAGRGGKAECDAPPTLRPPSLRGQLRLWSRALGDEELATRLWGTTETGQRVRILGVQELERPVPVYLLPHKDGKYRSQTPMVPPGQRALIRFALPERTLLEPLQAVVWTWLHLGGVGRRSRRGYGALVWEPHDSDLLDGFLEEGFVRARDLAGKPELEAYLETGLRRAWSGVGVTPTVQRRSSASFVLDSLDQVFVGEIGAGYRWYAAERRSVPGPTSVENSLECLLHGLDPASRGGSPNEDQLGRIKPSRQESPMAWRLFPGPKRGHLSVMTWSPRGYPAGAYPEVDTSSGRLGSYLKGDLGFDQSLAKQALAR